MSFGNNVVYYRKKYKITQEELSEKLDVTRQTVSRWETDSAFPDMDKLLEICKIFNCNMDTLVRGDAESEESTKDTKTLEEYDAHMNRFSKFTSAGVFLVLIGLFAMLLLNAFFAIDEISVVVFLLFVTFSVAIFISSGISHSNFVLEHTVIEEYPKERKSAFMRKMPFLISAATVIVLAGVIVLIALAGKDGYAPSGFTVDKWVELSAAIFFVFVAISASMFTYSGMQAAKYNVAEYNKKYGQPTTEGEEKSAKGNKINDAISRVVFLVATCIFLLLGFLKNLWHPAWVAFPIAAILCGISSIIIKAFFDNK